MAVAEILLPVAHPQALAGEVLGSQQLDAANTRVPRRECGRPGAGGAGRGLSKLAKVCVLLQMHLASPPALPG